LAYFKNRSTRLIQKQSISPTWKSIIDYFFGSRYVVGYQSCYNNWQRRKWGSDAECAFVDLRQEKEIWVKEKKQRNNQAPRQPRQQLTAADEEKLKEMLIVTSITVGSLKVYLRAHMDRECLATSENLLIEC
jgi:hypothetical protein